MSAAENLARMIGDKWLQGYGGSGVEPLPIREGVTSIEIPLGLLSIDARSKFSLMVEALRYYGSYRILITENDLGDQFCNLEFAPEPGFRK